MIMNLFLGVCTYPVAVFLPTMNSFPEHAEVKGVQIG